ncbi:topoisomerase C-terminal repeat-containing protein, partial [Staphylococcus aureus]
LVVSYIFLLCNRTGSLLDKGKVIKCNQCEQIFFKNFLKKKIPDKQLLSLFTKGKTTKSLKFKSKKGNDFSAGSVAKLKIM